jgi:hypothetical protein
MKLFLRYIGIIILFLCGVLSACSGTPADDEPLPTLAQLPTITPIINPVATETDNTAASNTPTAPEATIVVEPTSSTPNPIVLPDPLLPTGTATSVNDLGLDAFPEVLEVGTKITLQGRLTTDDVNSGVAILTNAKGQTVNLLVDLFTAMMANNQEVQISGTVERQTGNPANAVRVTEINMLNGTSALATATDSQAGFPLPDAPTSTP